MPEIVIARAEPIDAAKIVKFVRALHMRHQSRQPQWVERFGLLWVTDVVCRGVVINATLEGRVIGSIGMAQDHFPWNPYVKHMRGQWLHILDNFIEGDVRNDLITAAMNAAMDQEAELEITIPDYLWRTDDKMLTPLGSHYYYGLEHGES